MENVREQSEKSCSCASPSTKAEVGEVGGGNFNYDKSTASQRSQIIRLAPGVSSHLSFGIMVNGIDAVAIIDTGARISAIDRAFARKLNLALGATIMVRGVTHDSPAYVTDPVTMAIGIHTINTAPAVLDLSSISSAARGPIDVVLGLDIMAAFVVEIDVPGQLLRLCRPHDIGESLSMFGDSQPLTYGGDGMIQLTLRINDGRPVQGAIDFGSNVPLYVSPSYARGEQLMDGVVSSTALSVGAEGYSVSDVFTASLVVINQYEMNDVPIQAPRKWNFDTDCIIGMPLLRRLHFLFDFPNNAFSYSPIASEFDIPFPKDRSGLGVVASKQGLRVVHVATGSPAQLEGIRPGDEIILVNGKAIDTEFIRSRSRIGTATSGTRVELTFLSGNKKTITLRDYF